MSGMGYRKSAKLNPIHQIPYYTIAAELFFTRQLSFTGV